jgi:hypothetical protein
MSQLILFAQLIFGFFIFVRVTEQLFAKKLIAKPVVTKTVAALLGWMLGWAICPGITLSSYSVLLWAPLAALAMAPTFLRLKRRTQFRSELPGFLSSVILKMRVGMSFRASLQVSSQTLSEFSRVKIEQVLEGLTLDSSTVWSDETIGMLVSWFRAAETDSHRALPRIIQLREKLKVEDEMVRKMRQVLQQLRAQVIVLTILFLGLVAFVVYQFGFRQNAETIFFSCGLFAFGCWLGLRQGGSFQWKV